MPLNILHTADWQIGRVYAAFEPDDAAALSEVRLETVARIAAHAQEQGMDAVLVAGDVFDAQGVSDRTIRRLFNALDAYGGPWILLPGNHDAALSESVWTRARRMQTVPDNVHLALTPEVCRFPNLKLSVMPAPLTQRHTYDDLTAWFDETETESGDYRVGLAHGCVQGLLDEDIDSANPIAGDRVERARLDYLALGDWHGLRGINERCWYSGTPEPERFRQNDPGHVLEVALSAPGESPSVTPTRIGRYVWEAWRDELHVGSDLDALLKRLDEVSADRVVDLRPSGSTDMAARQRLRVAVEESGARARALRFNEDSLRLKPSAEDLEALHAAGYLGDVLEELRARLEREADEAAVVEQALLIFAELLGEQHREEDAS